MDTGPDKITLQRRFLDGLIEARDALTHRIGREWRTLEQLKENQRDQERKALCGN